MTAFVQFDELCKITGYATKAAVARYLKSRKVKYHLNRWGEPYTTVEAFNLSPGAVARDNEPNYDAIRAQGSEATAARASQGAVSVLRTAGRRAG